MSVLAFCARHGRWGLVVGLVAGLALPGLAQAMRPWLPHMVAGLLFITAFRVGYRGSVGQLRAAPRVLAEVLVLQLLLPLLGLAVVFAFGLSATTAALAIVLMLSAPSISGSPNFAVLVGHDPAPAMQIMVMGMALFPLTILPVLFLLGPALGDASGVLATSLRLIMIIFAATGLGFAARALLLPKATLAQIQSLDGAGVVALVVIVIGLMAGIGPVFAQSPFALAGWIALVFAANFGLQILTFTLVPSGPRAVPFSLIAGNRNVALFLLALPPELTDRLLPFIGCYQLPMYLTPLVMARLYRLRPHAG
ncbi:hypothetical protein A8B78_12570 [Jannaschia sp. EhC01]|nr:hypothetical protein A8B78_12570 [Jannaschia sp. EhC01]